RLDEHGAVWLRADSRDVRVKGEPVHGRVRLHDGDRVTWGAGRHGIIRFSRALHPDTGAENPYDPSRPVSVWNIPPWDRLDIDRMASVFLVRYRGVPVGVYKVGRPNAAIRNEVAAWHAARLVFPRQQDSDDQNGDDAPATGYPTLVPPTRAWRGPEGLG